MMFATPYNDEMKACTIYQSDEMKNEPSLDDLLAEVNSVFYAPSDCKSERPVTASTHCSSNVGGLGSISSNQSRPTTVQSSTTMQSSLPQVMKVDWNLPGGLDNSTPLTVASSLREELQDEKQPSMLPAYADFVPPRNESSNRFSPPPRNAGKSATAVRMAPEMINVEGTWISHGKRNVQLTVSGNIVSWSSGTTAKLICNHEQFWLISESGKHCCSADVREDGDGEITLRWTDGSIWSRKPLTDMEIKEMNAVVTTLKSGPSESHAPNRTRNFKREIRKSFGFCTNDQSKVTPSHSAVSSSKVTMDDVQGRWIIDSCGAQVEVTVDGNSVSWSTGNKASLAVHNDKQFWLTSESGKQIYLTGETTANGTLRWTNGSVWRRQVELAKEGKSSAAEIQEMA